MHASRKLAISLLMLGLSGGAFATADQTQPGASHGPSSAKNATGNTSSSTSKSTSDGGPTGGESGVGGTANGSQAAGKGTSTGSGGMQPRLDSSGSTNGRTSPATNGGGAQGW
jgi:hypothetical protein